MPTVYKKINKIWSLPLGISQFCRRDMLTNDCNIKQKNRTNGTSCYGNLEEWEVPLNWEKSSKASWSSICTSTGGRNPTDRNGWETTALWVEPSNGNSRSALRCCWKQSCVQVRGDEASRPHHNFHTHVHPQHATLVHSALQKGTCIWAELTKSHVCYFSTDLLEVKQFFWRLEVSGKIAGKSPFPLSAAEKSVFGKGRGYGCI